MTDDDLKTLARVEADVRNLAEATSRNAEQTERIAEALEKTLDKHETRIDTLSQRVAALETAEKVREGQQKAAIATGKLFWAAVVGVVTFAAAVLSKLGVF